MLTACALLDLPLDVFILVWDLLPLYAQVSLALTCRPLYTTYGPAALSQLKETNESSLAQKMYFLRRLKKDVNDGSLVICGGCMKLHSVQLDESDGVYSTNGIKAADRVARIAGIPHCNSSFARALRDVQARLQDERDLGPSYFSGKHKSFTEIRYQITVDVGREGLYMLTQYDIQKNTPGKSHRLSEIRGPGFIADVAELYRTTNMDLCPHLWFGDDFTPGDGTMNDQLECCIDDFYRSWPRERDRQPSYTGKSFVEFYCEICHVDIKTKHWTTSSLTLWVWQYFDFHRLEASERPARTTIPQHNSILLEPESNTSTRQKNHAWDRMLSWWRRRTS
ncbi:hypothetical protein BU24DRAFT_222665 [Aaosphaeria arxii CBS 175.79]|uniref:Uncharacterized protein n=1 Tax=Aaosphaeria arxii CBS 175.79 TaxID=1450172 RepID=A0A6A5XQ30_9PLEO|nr:uncharacterized protein BU24DRAFT_222665 [Aaosphaeria arxii CBS 175.79]KAF2014830.1 hypothetical protein BU24DRAFT_222665 [Aaosphaeria arxii CBS 175.79]